MPCLQEGLSSRASNRPDIETSADGSTTIYFGPTAPEAHGRPFEGIFRLYGPHKSFFEKSWKLPDIEPAG